jgi:hypothetical protein
LKMGHPPEFLSSGRARDVANIFLRGIAGKGKRKGHKNKRV